MHGLLLRRCCVDSKESKHRRGAKVAGDGVEVHVVVDYGANIPAVAAEVQQRVAAYLERMADLRPADVTVVVDDVQRP